MAQQDSLPQTNQTVRPFLVAYGVTVATLFLLSFLPEGRIWGLNTWAWLPLSSRLILLAAASIVPLLAVRLEAPEAELANGRGYPVLATLIGLCLTTILLALPQETHFLGDGYTVLGWLEGGGILNKARNFGAQTTLRLADQVIPGETRQTFRIVAWGAGVLGIAATLYGSAIVFTDTRKRLLLALGVLSGGYMLLFFGYVENYALFMLMVLLYCWTGVLTLRSGANRWWILLPQAGAVFFHIFGLTFLPATAYLLLRGSRAGRRLDRIDVRTRRLVAAAVVVAALGAFGWFWTHSYFFRFAVLPVVQDRFTVRGYTLLSLPHLGDFANLLLILAPGLLLFGAACVRVGLRAILRQPLLRFLGLAMLGGLGAAFLFDPKLGMPRDWDLFALGGAPLVMAGMILLLDNPRALPWGLVIASLAAALGFLSLIPRAIVQHSPEMAIAQFQSHRQLDPIRNRNGSIYLVDYYRRVGDTVRAEAARAEWHAAGKDEQYVRQGNAAQDAGAFDQAIELYAAALRENPISSVAYTNMANTYLRIGKSDSALMAYEVADGLNPGSPIILSNLGNAYYQTGQSERALEVWQRAIKLEPAIIQPRRFLVHHYRSIRDRENYVAMLEEIAGLDGAPADNLAALANWYLQSHRLSEAGRLYDRALKAGLDSTQVLPVFEKYPAFKEEFPSWIN